ncbi:MAG: hypothetical protein ABIY37_10415 [Devosia sp.]
MTKQEAEQEAIRRWNLLPEHLRETYEQAEAYALRLDLELVFPSVMDPRRLIAAWLIREVTTKRRFERESRIAAERLAVAAEMTEAAKAA